jgi:hypothetical protein
MCNTFVLALTIYRKEDMNRGPGRPRKVVTTTIEEQAGDENVIEAQDSLSQPSVERIEANNLVEQMRSLGNVGARCMLYRADKYKTAMCFVGAVAPEIVSEEYIQEEYGEGRYQIRVIDSGGKFLVHRVVEIGPPKSAQLAQAKVAVLPPAVGDPLMQARLESMIQEQATTREMMLRLIDKIGAHDGQGSTLTEFAAVITTVQGLMPKAATATDAIKEAVGIFREGMKLGASGGGAEKGWMETIKDVLGSLPELIAGAKTMSAMQQVQPVTEVSALNPSAESVENQSAEMLRQGIAYLKLKARQGKDPGLWIDVIADNLDDPQWIPLATKLDLPFEEFARIDAQLLTPLYRPWFMRLFAGVRDALHERVSSGDGQTGNLPDAADDAPSGS